MAGVTSYCDLLYSDGRQCARASDPALQEKEMGAPSSSRGSMPDTALDAC